MAETITEIIRRWEKASQDKSRMHNHYDDLARVMLPSRIGFAETITEGERRTEDIYDGTPMQAARGLANAIGGMMRPEGLPVVKMKPEDDALDNLDEVKDWLADSEERMKDAFNNPRARFRQASAEKDQDLVVFGTANMFVGESRNYDRLLFQTLHLKDACPYFNEEGEAEGMFFLRKITIRNAVKMFGEAGLHETTRKKFETSPDEKVRFLRVVEPRKNYKKGAMLAKNLPFTDCWIELDQKHKTADGGFHEFPYVVVRWDTSSGEDFGRSPGMIALPDADTLQAMGETILIAGQRSADPPLMAPNDGSFSALNTFPGGLSYYDVETAVAVRGNPFFPLESGANLPITRDMQSDVRMQIFAAFFKNILNLPIEGPQMTATEVIQRKEEFMREIGPVFGRLETDDTAPTVERVFMIMLRNGAFAPIPQILQGRNIRFEYESPVKRIRQQIEATAAKMWAAEMLQLSELKPGAADLINEDELGRFTAEAAGVPRKIVNSAEMVEYLRESKRQAEEAAQQAMMLQQGAEVAKTGAEAMKTAGLIQEPAA